MWVLYKLKMKKIVLFICFFFVAEMAFAQVKPIFFNGDDVISDSTKATSYAIYGKLTTENLWVFKRYDLYNNLIQTGSYIDSLLSIPHGKFVFYNYIADFNAERNENFKLKNKMIYLSQQGNFVNGAEQGSWLLFYPDGNILNLQNFEAGKQNGKFCTYDKYGKILIEGNYKDGKRDGEWLFSREKLKIVYDMDLTISTTSLLKRSKKKN